MVDVATLQDVARVLRAQGRRATYVVRVPPVGHLVGHESPQDLDNVLELEPFLGVLQGAELGQSLTPSIAGGHKRESRANSPGASTSA